jgi:hypothetical protein
MKAKLLKTVVVACLAGLFVAGCNVYVRPAGVAVVAPGEVEVTSAPPAAPPYPEVVTAAPGPEFIWIGGVWTWGGRGWVWERGHWDRRPHPGAIWVPHHYEYRNGRHVFVRGGWK